MRPEDRRKPVEFGPSENAPDSEVREPPNARAAQSPGRIPLALPPIRRLAQTTARRASDKAPPYSVGRSRRKTWPRRYKAVEIQKAFPHYKEPPLGTNPSARATPGFSHSRISRELVQITPARQAPFPVGSTPWLRKPGISLPRIPFLIFGIANSLRERIPWLPC